MPSIANATSTRHDQANLARRVLPIDERNEVKA
jgi:hypothetical protein